MARISRANFFSLFYFFFTRNILPFNKIARDEIMNYIVAAMWKCNNATIIIIIKVVIAQRNLVKLMREGEREREGEVCQRGKTGGEEDGFSFSFFLFLKKVSRRNSPRQSSPLTPLINVILTCSFKNCLFAQSLVAVRNLQVHFPPSCFLPSFLFLFFFCSFHSYVGV